MTEPSRKRVRANSTASKSGPEPRIFHRSFGTETGPSDIREIYSEACVAQLCSGHRIAEPGHVAALWDFLAFAASAYFVSKLGKYDRPRPPEIAAQLVTIAEL